ncbi:hypothetical protein [Cyanobium sp. WAJ14-Wanaka]|uniref:hypothetical protein n=1 Tax=Cyanobium sp. WAJ14-Wanaka TaxID=2823725 RepID=UPI0020CF1139|nr:hypothetical protein [Cyanobium sp. WAJ14-Wanaka]MCP9775369.1 hypothetical protein [Cyanobium sp. WAJ14-Wanaka]
MIAELAVIQRYFSISPLEISVAIEPRGGKEWAKQGPNKCKGFVKPHGQIGEQTQGESGRETIAKVVPSDFQKSVQSVQLL